MVPVSSLQIHTSLSPLHLQHYSLQNTTVVIIDVFRATSTIAAALYNGATAVIPVDNVEKAVNISKNIGGIAAGERDGKIAEGLVHGNSPLEYPRSFIEGQTLVLTTTNGTRLLQMALNQGAETIITGSFPNLQAVCDFLIAKQQHVLLCASGWKDRFNLEDTIFAGAVISRIEKHFAPMHCDSSLMAKIMFENYKDNLYDFAKQFTHYHRLVERFGLIEDIRFCLTNDIAPVLPLYRDQKLYAHR